MKNQRFLDRLGFALRGIRAGWRTESSFRFQSVMASAAVVLLLIARPEPLWWALFFLVIGAVLAAELFNTALEHVIDRLHPEVHPLIAQSKDCAAAAVLLLSIAAIGIGIAFAVAELGPIL